MTFVRAAEFLSHLPEPHRKVIDKLCAYEFHDAAMVAERHVDVIPVFVVEGIKALGRMFGNGGHQVADLGYVLYWAVEALTFSVAESAKQEAD